MTNGLDFIRDGLKTLDLLTRFFPRLKVEEAKDVLDHLKLDWELVNRMMVKTSFRTEDSPTVSNDFWVFITVNQKELPISFRVRPSVRGYEARTEQYGFDFYIHDLSTRDAFELFVEVLQKAFKEKQP
jgi:hypothetical protein